MRAPLLLVLLLTTPFSARADITCTAAAPATWLSQSQFRAEIKARGYQITKFKVTPGNCYEIYGFDAQKRPVEIYHDPVTGRPMKYERIKPPS